MKQSLSLLAYKTLDWLKQESPFWWAIVQLLLWASFLIISTNLLNFKGEDVVLVILGGLISSVGSRTSKKLSESREVLSVNPDDFRKGFNEAQNSLDKLVPLKPKERTIYKIHRGRVYIRKK